MKGSFFEKVLSPAPSGRRDFLRVSALGLAVPAVAAACDSGPTPAAAATGHAPAAPVNAAMKADEMDRMHEAGIKSFPAKTEGKGNQLMKPRIEAGVKCYDLVVKKVQWEVEPWSLRW